MISQYIYASRREFVQIAAYGLSLVDQPHICPAMKYAPLFEKHPTLAAILEDYFGDVLQFHINAMSVFCRPRMFILIIAKNLSTNDKLDWKKLFKSIWKTFNGRFHPILTSLQSRRRLLESEKASATISGVDKLREQIDTLSERACEQAEKAVIDRHQDRMRQIHNKLKAPDYELDRSISAEDSSGGSFGKWLFACSECTQTGGHQILYINAIPGAGKSTSYPFKLLLTILMRPGKTSLMTKVINRLLELKHVAQEQRKWTPVLYFYCKYDQPDKRSFNSILRGLLDQILNQDPALADDLSENIMSVESVTLSTTEGLTKLLERSLNSYDFSFLIIDGLDECSDVGETLDWFPYLTSQQLDMSNGGIRVIFSGQRDGVLDKTLACQPAISLESPDHLADVRRCCEQRSAPFRQKFHLSGQETEDIIDKVASGAQGLPPHKLNVFNILTSCLGMFLFAKVVLNNLVSQPTRSRLKNELKDDTLT